MIFRVWSGCNWLSLRRAIRRSYCPPQTCVCVPVWAGGLTFCMHLHPARLWQDRLGQPIRSDTLYRSCPRMPLPQAATYDELVGSEERRHRWRQMVLASCTPRVSLDVLVASCLVALGVLQHCRENPAAGGIWGSSRLPRGCACVGRAALQCGMHRLVIWPCGVCCTMQTTMRLLAACACPTADNPPNACCFQCSGSSAAHERAAGPSGHGIVPRCNQTPSVHLTIVRSRS